MLVEDKATGFCQIFDTPLGLMFVAERGGELVRVDFIERANSRIPETLIMGLKESGTSLLTRAKIQMEEYFEGRRTRFDLKFKLSGTAFQLRTWNALCNIPYGETWSYGELARSIGRPKASRAVGGANGLNPIPVIIPCHRVVGSNGKLTGFGGGIKTKEYLLKLEKEVITGIVGATFRTRYKRDLHEE